jgi:lysophospholipase L1-like esterase
MAPSYGRQTIQQFERSLARHLDWPVVLSEGDSWFSHADVVGHLDDPKGTRDPKDQRPWALLRLEQSGDEILTILSGAQRARLRALFERSRFDAVLFSGGGNDLVGTDLLPLLLPYVEGMTAPDLVAYSRFERRIRQIQDCYRELLDLLGDAGQGAKVFVNSYDYAIPSKRPVKLLGLVEVAGPWLLPALAARGIPMALHGEVVKLLVDGFCAAVDQVAAEPRGAGRLIRVETRGVVGKDYADEIHPNRAGAKRVAKAFEGALRREGVLA